MGFVVGMTFLFFCLVGPLALLIPVIAWLVIKNRKETPPPVGPPRRRRARQRPNLG
jgi:hypothetical protein